MKICIVTYDEYRNIPYVKEYENILKSNNISWDIILWERTEQSTFSPDASNSYIFRNITKKSRLSKILPFMKWRSFVKNILNKQKYDKLIICTTIPAFLISDMLVKKYSTRYLLDIRDYTYENVSFFKKKENLLIKHAGLTVISSLGFLEWLPLNNQYIITHNISNLSFANEDTANIQEKKRMTIGFVGGVRYFSINEKIIELFKNNEKYKLLYVGKHHPGSTLKEFCRTHKIENVEFQASYINEQKPDIYRNIDIINSVYGDDTPETRTLMSHKLYDCLIYKKPIMVHTNTFMEKIVKKYGLGCAINLDYSDTLESLNNYICQFDAEQFNKNANEFLCSIIKEQKEMLSKVSDFLLKEI